MDFKKIAGQAGQFLTRAVQYTEEKLGNAEKTEFDGHYEALVIQADSTRIWTEKLVAGGTSVVIPNPGNRVEDFVYEKVEKRRPNRLSNLEHFGLDMVQTGTEFGPGTAYGAALLKVGTAEQKLGLAERDFVGATLTDFITPLQKFLDTEMKTITRERRLLDSKRLDLDACKSRLRKARSMESQNSAEADLRRAQAEFDRQTEITKLLLEGVRSCQPTHLRHLNNFVEAQAQYYEQCHKVMKDLNKELSTLTMDDSSTQQEENSASPRTYPKVNGTTDEERWRKAKVVCDYDATSKEEMSLIMNEEISYRECKERNADYVMAQRGTQTGVVPRAYIDPMDD